MKKISVLLLSVLFVSVSLTSCSNDDDNNGGGSGDAALVGSWEFSQYGYVIDGEEVLEDYDHWAPECGLDHVIFNANNTGVSVEFDDWDGDCEEWEDAFQWTLEGNILTIQDAFDTVELEVAELTNSILKVYEEFEFMGETMTIVLVLNRM